MMLYYGIRPGAAAVWLPVFLLLAILTALGVGLWLSALNAIYRDVRYMIAVSRAILDVRVTGGLSEFTCAGEMVLAVWPESDGGRDRRISLVADRTRPSAGTAILVSSG